VSSVAGEAAAGDAFAAGDDVPCALFTSAVAAFSGEDAAGFWADVGGGRLVGGAYPGASDVDDFGVEGGASGRGGGGRAGVPGLPGSPLRLLPGFRRILPSGGSFGACRGGGRGDERIWVLQGREAWAITCTTSNSHHAWERAYSSMEPAPSDCDHAALTRRRRAC
jgi:hypothetical protein